MTFVLKYAVLTTGITILIVAGCKKKNDTSPDVPQVRTANVANITPTTARSGGTIISDGGSAITASGICWSRNDHDPTIADDTTKGTTATGSFTADMGQLQPGTTYYVRAYAINRGGVGYGDRESFTTGNAAPIAIGIIISGNKSVGQRIVARYTYFDLENNPESGTTFQWYIANDTTGAAVTSISNATDSAYTLAAADQNKFLRVGITPRALTGTSPGQEYRSSWVGPITAPDPNMTVTFTYNGQTVTYGVITSPVTGRKWLDRNLGAPNTPTSIEDWRNMGDLFQWGRKADGHQLINRGATLAETTPVHGFTATKSASDNPGHSLFIVNSLPPFDWRDPQNDNLWQVSGGTNNACPAGWHIPDSVEWGAENINSLHTAFTRLKLTSTGLRVADGSIQVSNILGIYWSSSVASPNWIRTSFISTINASISLDHRASGHAVRCIKD
jgi:hypothetical protein